MHAVLFAEPHVRKLLVWMYTDGQDRVRANAVFIILIATYDVVPSGLPNTGPKSYYKTITS